MALTWSEIRPCGDVDKIWIFASRSYDGKRTIVSSNAGRIWLSSDALATWSELRPAGDVDKGWRTIMSDNGKYLLACDGSTRVFISADYGANWTETRPVGDANGNWMTPCSSADGKYVYLPDRGNTCAESFNGRLWKSSDYGATWAEMQPGGNVQHHWRTVACSPDGKYVLAAAECYSGAVVGERPRRLYSSSDYGVNWTERQPAGNVDLDWHSVSVSQDGKTMLAGCWAGRLWVSRDSGASWTETRPAGDADKGWYYSKLSPTGQIAIAGGIGTDSLGDRLWLSFDGCCTWIEARPKDDANYLWVPVHVMCLDDRVEFLAAVQSTRMYKGVLALR